MAQELREAHSTMIPRIALTIAALALAPACHAGSFMRSGGESFVSVGLAMDRGDRIFNKQGQRESTTCDPSQSLTLYAEHGWSYYTTVFASGLLRHQACGSGDDWGLDSGKLGIARRLDPLSSRWVWEAALLFPSHRFGYQSSSQDAFGLEAALHFHPRPDPYDLDRAIDPLRPYWDFGAGIKAWAGGLPLEGWVGARYTRPLREMNPNTGAGGWAASFSLDYSQTLAGGEASSPLAVDNEDDYWRLDAGIALKHSLRRHESLRLELKSSLAGENTYDNREISLRYEKTFAR
jgi:hypothetical protein